MAKLKFGVALALTVVWCYFLNRPVSILPPVGRLFDPFSGFWQNCESEQISFEEEVQPGGLKAPAKVVYDERRVPHIFAENLHDLAYLQGYVTARDRLFQMELQTRFAGGRISEWIGLEAAVINDRRMRRMGLGFGAEKALDAISRDPVSAELLKAYRDGVNAWISQLSYSDYPVEYKLLNQVPEPWTEIKTCLLLKMMAFDLTGRTEDVAYTNALKLFGRETFDLLYPAWGDTIDPVIPREVKWEMQAAPLDTPRGYSPLDLYSQFEYAQPDENNGSNNWAVAGTKTASGYPMLANDPHLGLRLPSLWYEVQLSMPGMNVYGVSLPGAPLVVIGFNEKIAWGLTNAGRDVLDWYKITFKDKSCKEYKYGDKWLPTEFVYEKMNVAGKGEITDTVMYTLHGPVVFDQAFAQGNNPIHMACRWIAHDSSNELKTFYGLARAASYDDYRAALSNFDSPGQNFVFASASGDIAITQQGKFPHKWPDQGRFVLDGSNPRHDWQAFIPREHAATVKNPAQGFVSSANQHAVDASYPYAVYGGYEFYRNRRINQVLGTWSKATVEDMKKLQLDNFNLNAAENLDTLIAMLETAQLTPDEKAVLEDLKKWNRINEADLTAPSAYEAWCAKIADNLLDDEIKKAGGPIPLPKDMVYATLVRKHPNAQVFDDRSTAEQEDATDIVNKSFRQAVDSLNRWSAVRGAAKWVWTDFRNTEINHLVPNLKPFGRRDIHSPGNYNTVNSVKKAHGPSWRMIVELGPKVQGWGIYPGGTSGNPGSVYYDNGVTPWSKGEYFPLHLFSSADSKQEGVKFIQTFKP